MTNSSLRFALNGALALSVLILAGCGEKDGAKELAEGWTAYGVHDLKKAERMFDKSIGHNAENVDAIVASARVKLELGKIAAAKDVLAKAEALAGEDDDVLMLGAQIAYHAKDYKAAENAFRRFAKDAKRDVKRRAEAYVGLAVVEMTCNDHDRARVSLLTALLLDRRSASARYHLGMLYRNLGYDEAALEQFEAYVMLNQIADVRIQRVQRQVIPALKDAVAHKAAERPGVEKRDSALAARNLQNAETEWKKGNFKRAKACYAEALKADPLSYAAAFGLAQAWEKTDATEKGRRNALDCYQTACSIKPGAVRTLLSVARMGRSLGNAAVAAEAYSRVLAFDPKNIEALDGTIRSLRKTNVGMASLWQGYRDALRKK